MRPKLSVPEQWTRRLMLSVDALSMPRGLLLGVGISGVCGYGLLRAGPQWGLGGAMLLLGTACTLALTGDAVAELQPEPDPASNPKPDSTAEVAPIPPASAKPKPLPEPLEMIELPGGEFWMGSPDSEAGRYENELRHRVTVRAFAIGKFPVTQKQYIQVMGENPSYHNKPMEGERAEDRPVENVSWFDAVRFCNRLSEKIGIKPCYRITEHEAGSDAPPQVEWDQDAERAP